MYKTRRIGAYVRRKKKKKNVLTCLLLLFLQCQVSCSKSRSWHMTLDSQFKCPLQKVLLHDFNEFAS